MKNGKRAKNNIIYQIDDNTQIIFRRDTGLNAHPISSHGYTKDQDHYNVEIQEKNSAGKWKHKWSYDIIIDDQGHVIKSF